MIVRRGLAARVRTAALFTLLVAWPTGGAHAFSCLEVGGRCIHWSPGEATLQLSLGSAGGTLSNGTLTWDQNGVAAANDWNAVGAAFHYTTQVGGTFVDPCGQQGEHACPNSGPVGSNPVFFSSSFCSMAFGADIIELTNNCYRPDTGEMLNAPVFVNANVRWDAYDGPLRIVGGHGVNDIRRVLLHEFGHVLGLRHPDDAHQNVAAIMNSHESDIDRLRADDKNGIVSIYPNGAPGPGDSGPAPNGCALGPARASGRGWIVLVPGGLGLLWRRRVEKRARRRAPVRS